MKFTFYLPTRIISGAHCVREHRALLKELGTRAFIMTGKQSAEKNGSLAEMTEALSAEGIEWVHFNAVTPNPSLSEVRAAAEEAKTSGTDFIVALGGGSPMDAAKAVAVLAAGEVSDQQLLSQRKFERALPLVAVPTTAGTGSEVTPYSILTNDALQTKSFLNSEQVYPRFAFLDGRYTMELPQAITAATVVDALSHAAEGYLAVRAIPLGRTLALESLRLIGTILPALAEKRALTLEQRETLLYASMLAGIVISQSGTTAVHAMGYSLTYFKGLDHGMANGLLLAEYFRFIQQQRVEEIQQIVDALGLQSINALENILETLLGKITLTAEEVERFASIAIKAGNILNTNPQPSKENLHTMLSNCFAK
ncbi:iron-containing alcohol dehydrogenase [Candidatus Moduliflexus flocculans]|uniref:Iron-containing alcohol dehydrogenase n=1 Tax=Candidatus Moduliflexus flocculans TaxID=1499966 RepID=A0A0S6VX06_9BACT|nr:iron-containing alcohol dehydrogenase [Candidatus Moduliflexus flocculans]